MKSSRNTTTTSTDFPRMELKQIQEDEVEEVAKTIIKGFFFAYAIKIKFLKIYKMIDKWKRRKEKENDKMINSIKQNDTFVTMVNQNKTEYILIRRLKK